MEAYSIEKFQGLKSDLLGVLSEKGVAELAYDIDFRAKRGRLQGLKGAIPVNTVGAISGLCTYNGEVINSISNTLYSSGSSILASWGGSFDNTIIESQLILVNGTQPVKYDGSNVYNVGITAPDLSSTTATASGSGSFQVGSWAYKVTFVNGNGFESNTDTDNDVTVAALPDKDHVALASIPTGAAADNVTARKIYRTEDGGTDFYLLATISDNTTTEYNDTTTDANLGSTTYPTNHDAPPSDLVVIEEANGFLLGVKSSDRTKLYYSLPSATNWEGWPTTYFSVFPDNIRGVRQVGERTIVITESATHAFIMPSSDVNTFYDRELGFREPTKSGESLSRWGEALLFRGTRGLYATDSITLQFISALQESLFDIVSTSQVFEASESTGYYILTDILFSQEGGLPIAMSDAQGNDYSFSSEYGIVIAIADTDTYTFSAELGVMSDVGSNATTSELLIIDLDYDNIHSIMRTEFTVVAFDYQNNIMYGGDTTGVKRLFVGSPGAWQWRSEWSYLDFPAHWKRLDKCYFYCSGEVILNIYLDMSGTAAYTKTFTAESMTLQTVTFTRNLWCHVAKIEFVASSGAAVDPPFVLYFETAQMDMTRNYA